MVIHYGTSSSSSCTSSCIAHVAHRSNAHEAHEAHRRGKPVPVQAGAAAAAIKCDLFAIRQEIEPSVQARDSRHRGRDLPPTCLPPALSLSQSSPGLLSSLERMTISVRATTVLTLSAHPSMEYHWLDIQLRPRHRPRLRPRACPHWERSSLQLPLQLCLLHLN